MRFLFLLAGDENKASSRVRGYWVAESLRNQGHSCTMVANSQRFNLLKYFFGILSYDVLVFQKTYSRYHIWLLQWARFWKRQSLLDIDDAPSRNNSPVTLKNFKRMASMTTAVLAGSENLVNYVAEFQPQVYLVPSSIPLSKYPERPSHSGKLCLGWIGNGRHYKEDLIHLLVPALKELCKTHDLKLKIVGALYDQELHRAFEEIPRLELEMIDEIEWSSAIEVSSSLDGMDIGLYPLLENEFNSFKCGFKALEYMAKGIPVVSSDVAINAKIIDRDVNGIIVEESAQWQAELLRLIEDETLRRTMGAKGREKVEKEYSIEEAANIILSSTQANYEKGK